MDENGDYIPFGNQNSPENGDYIPFGNQNSPENGDYIPFGNQIWPADSPGCTKLLGELPSMTFWISRCHLLGLPEGIQPG